MASGGGLLSPPNDNPMDLDARSGSAAEAHAAGQAGEVEQLQQQVLLQAHRPCHHPLALSSEEET